MDEHHDDTWTEETGEPRFIGQTLEERKTADAERRRLVGRIEELEEHERRQEKADIVVERAVKTSSSTVRRLGTEIALLRRERALLVDLEKARCEIISAFAEGREVPSRLFRAVGRLNDAVAAVHLEASGGIERPPGSACACILCREYRSEHDQKQVGEEVQLVGSPPEETCTACGEDRETFDGRCHDCISAHRRGED